MNILHILGLAQIALAATVTYNWDITWVEANPDGKLKRPVIGMTADCCFLSCHCMTYTV
jgi:iron transport multicopper oxidase